jgi:type VI secretion system protein VasD
VNEGSCEKKMIGRKTGALRAVGRAALVAAFAAIPVAGGLGVLASCGQREIVVQAPKQCELQVVSLTVLASQDLNPTENGDPRPVQLRIYQLKSEIQFSNSSFDEVWKKDKEILKEDIVKVDEISVFPNSRTEVKFERSKDANYVVAAALFRNWKGRSWYTTFELPPDPGKGACGLAVDPAKCPDGGCEDAGAGPILNPKYSVYLEQTRIDVGDDHLDEYPDGGRVQVIHLTSGGGGGGGAGSGAPAGDKAPPAGSK